MSWSSTSLLWLKPRNAFLTLLHVTLLTLSFSVNPSSAISTPLRLPASPGYRGRSNACPTRCAVSGPNPANWSMYHNFDQLASCQESIFYSFSFLDPVDDSHVGHHIYACTSFGPDWGNLPVNTTKLLLQSSDAPEPVNGTYQIGHWPSTTGSSVSGSLGTLGSQLRQYLAGGFGPSDGPTILFARYGSTSVGLYVGQGLDSRGIGENVLSTLEHSIATANASNAASVAMQFCEPGQTSHHVFGLIATGNRTFASIQDALSSWSKAQCLTFPIVQNITGKVALVKPLFDASSKAPITTSTRPSASHATPIHRNTTSIRGRALTSRSTCSTVQVVSGNCYDSLASECGIAEAEFLAYNNVTNSDCDTLVIGEHFCCSAGTLPDYSPQPQSDGTCATYTIQANDNCETIAASYSLTMDELENYNNDTWGWSGCNPLYANTIICLSEGTAPMPAALANAECGPQVPGTVAPSSGTNISTLNECPLNACCDVWGQCGTTPDFCTDTSTGAPGTAKNGTNGCISNCGTDIVQSDPPATYRQVGFFEGYNLQRPCLNMDVSQIDVTAYTHIYFSFGVLDSSYEVQIPNDTTTGTTYEFGLFKQLTGTARILSIGGWSFSTDLSTYMIFRDGVTAANRLTMATNIANFIKDNDLDGVNIDWEYPGATDIPGIPAASSDDGVNYLAFLAILRNLLPDKEVTIAAPASYWYLKGFPISAMAKIVDYIIYMTYDLHGQWDANSQWSQDGCPTGTCLRSDVNITETEGALSMITKAGVPSNQVVVGVTSYGRSFAMAEAGCCGPNCTYLGSADHSQAEPGECTQTAGYIANAEILAILANSSRVNEDYIDIDSNSNILVYDDTQWVGWMSDGIKTERKLVYKGLSMGGWTDWAIDLQEFQDAPFTSTSWTGFISDAVLDVDPYEEGNRTGNWTSLTCSDPAVQDALYMSCSQRWSELDASNAWSDALNVWLTIDEPKLPNSEAEFTLSIMNTLHGPEDVNCGSLAPNGHCDSTETCAEFEGFGDSGGSGPAAMLIYESFTVLNAAYSQLYNAIIGEAATYLDNLLPEFEDTFAPVPPTESDEWLDILIDLFGLGLTAVAAPFFDGVFGELPALEALGDSGAQVAQDMTYSAIAYGASIATSSLPSKAPGSWSVESQKSFSATMGTVLNGWSAAVEDQLWMLFNGSSASITLLTTLISDGKLIECNGAAPSTEYNSTGSRSTDVEGFVGTAFFGYAIPTLWTVSGTAAFVIDSGYSCSETNPMTEYMTDSTQEATSACYNDKLYYLVYPDGTYYGCTGNDLEACTQSYFTAPPGLDTLSNTTWGGITLSDLIEGSVNTYVANGNSNGGSVANPMDEDTMKDLANRDITTPGYIRLPVCSAQVAWASWSTPSQSNSSAPGYPCNPLQGLTECSSYTYEDQTTSASPTVADCKVLMSNIAGTNGKWTTGIGGQREIPHYGTCKFGVQNDGVTGDVTYYTGSQDVINIITESIALYEWEGLVGAKGYMECKGDAGKQKVEWGYTKRIVCFVAGRLLHICMFTVHPWKVPRCFKHSGLSSKSACLYTRILNQHFRRGKLVSILL